jgi:cytochrome c oxidase assembly protein subunit 15
MCWGAVTIGGLTRFVFRYSVVIHLFYCSLTESGLSIVEWNLFRGMRPPMNDADWINEFEKYKQFPEYELFVSLLIN